MGGKSSRKVFAVFFYMLLSSVLLCPDNDVVSLHQRSPEKPRPAIRDTFQPLESEMWQSNGPMGGNVVSIKARAENPNDIYALVNCSYSLSCIYKSMDAGKNWTMLATLNRDCYDMALHPQDPQTLFVLSSYAVFKSTDGGANWTQHSLGSRNYGSYGQIVMDPIDPDILHAVGYHYYSSANYCMAAFKSTDGGANWIATYIQPDSIRGQAYCIDVNPSSPNILYLGGYLKEGYYTRYKLYKSTDRGETWQDATGTIGGYPRSIVTYPTNPSKVLVGTNWGVYRSSDGGQTWEIGGHSACANALGMNPSDPNTIYAGYNSRCFKSTDGGVNWTEYTAGLNGDCQDILVNPGSVYYGSFVGIHKSMDGGKTWESSHNGIKNNVIPAIAVARSSPNVIYAEAAQNGLFKSTDFGNSWVRLPDFYRCESIFSICVNSADPDDLVLLAGG